MLLAMAKRAKPEGIVVRHAVGCASQLERGRCDCRPGYQAQVYSAAERRTIRKTFRTLADARAWRAETKAALERGSLRAPSRQTLEQAAKDWLKAAKAGVIRTRSGDPYKPGALRRLLSRSEVSVNPTLGLSLPAIRIAAIESPAPRRRGRCSRRLAPPIARPGRRPSTPASGAASCAPCAGAMWTSRSG